MIEKANGDKFWTNNGQFHREGGLPAVILNDGQKEWWLNGLVHREGGLPAVEKANGHKEWWVKGHIYQVQFKDGTVQKLQPVETVYN